MDNKACFMSILSTWINRKGHEKGNACRDEREGKLERLEELRVAGVWRVIIVFERNYT